MKSKLPIILLLFVFGFLFQAHSQVTCNLKNAIALGNSAMPGFRYSGSKATKIVQTDKEKNIEIITLLFDGTENKFVFIKDNPADQFEIEIYDKPFADITKSLLFSTRDTPFENNILIFDPNRHSGLIYVNYLIPAAENGSVKAYDCINLIMGSRAKK